MGEELRTELLAMVDEDQRVRLALAQEAERDEAFHREWTRRTDPENSEIGVLAWEPETAPPVVREMWAVDRRHLERMRDLIARNGGPGKSLVGRDGAHAAWLLVLHADADRRFQRCCLVPDHTGGSGSKCAGKLI
jgi:hypothetical protein